MSRQHRKRQHTKRQHSEALHSEALQNPIPSEYHSEHTRGPLASTPDELIANLPGLLGFYPEESFIVQGYYSRADGSACIGPTVRVDLSAELPVGEIASYLHNADCSFHLGFVVSKRATCSLQEDQRRSLRNLGWYHSLRDAVDTNDISLMGCWLVEETRQNARYRLLFGSKILDDECTSSVWRTGEVASVMASPAMRPWSKRNELPSLTRDEAFEYLLGDQQDDRDAERAERTRRLVRDVDRLGSIKDYATGDALVLVNEIAESGLSAVELLAENDIVETVGLWMSRTDIRDQVMEVMVLNPQPAKELLIATVRSFIGLPRINALATLAIVFLELGKTLNASQALTVALHEAPDHRLSQLLFAALSSGAQDEALSAIKRGILDENGR